MSRRLLFFTLLAALAPCAPVVADALILKDGKTVQGKSFRRDGETIYVTVEVPGPDGKLMAAERGTALADVARVDCAPAPVLKDSIPLLAQGNTAAALAQIEPAAAAAEAFGDLPGSPWPDLAVLHAHTLIASGKDAAASLIADRLTKASDEQVKNAGHAIHALLSVRKGALEKAASEVGPLIQPGQKPATVAAASVARGVILLSQKKHPEALLSFLEIPVFTPDVAALSAMAQLGAAQCYFGMEDFDRAISTLEALAKAQPSSPEARTAQTLLPEYQRRKRVVNEAKE